MEGLKDLVTGLVPGQRVTVQQSDGTTTIKNKFAGGALAAVIIYFVIGFGLSLLF